MTEFDKFVKSLILLDVAYKRLFTSMSNLVNLFRKSALTKEKCHEMPRTRQPILAAGCNF